MQKSYFLSFLLFIILLMGPVCRAQLVSGYQFQAQAGTYVPLGAQATRISALEADEAVVPEVPLGFTFVARGHFFTRAAVSSNGWLALSLYALNSAEPSSYSIYFNSLPEIRIAPLWADLSGSGGNAFYQTTGAAPNRVFTMEWRNFRWDRLATEAVVSFQVKLYEGSNRIEYSYRPEAGSVSSPNAYFSEARAGLRLHHYNATASRNDDLIVLDDLGPAPQLSSTPRPGTLAKPATGQQYQFTPSPNTIPACEGPDYYRLARLGQRTACVEWGVGRMRLGGTTRVHYGPAGFVLGSAADRLAVAFSADSAQLTGLVPETNYEYLVETDCGTGTAPARTARTAFRTYTPPSNDEGSRAIWIPVLEVVRPGQVTPGSCQDASTSLPASPSCTAPAGIVRDVWYVFRATESSHQLMIETGNWPGAYVAELRDGYGPGSRSLGCTAGMAPSQISNLVVGRAYFVRVYPVAAASAYFQLAVLRGSTPRPANDDCATAQSVAVAAAPGALPAVAGTVRHATASGLGLGGTGSCAQGSSIQSKDVFYRFVAPGPTVEVQLRPSFRAGLEVLSDCSRGSLNYQNCIDAPAGQLSSFPLTGLTPGATYYLRVYNQWEVVVLPDASFTIAVSSPASPPANDACATALPLPVTATFAPGVAGTLQGATDSGISPPAAPCYAAPSFAPAGYTAPAIAADVWYQFTATTDTHVLQLNSTRDAVLEVLSSPAGMLPCAGGSSVQRLGCALARRKDPSFTEEAPPLPARLLLPNLTVGRTYWVRVFSAAAATALQPHGDATFTLSLSPWQAPANDEPATATPVAVAPVPEPCASRTEFTLDGATPTFPAASGSAWVGRDVWYSFVAPPAAAGSPFARVLLRLGEGSQHMLQGGVELRDGIDPTVYGGAGTGNWTSSVRVIRPLLVAWQLTPGRRYYVRFFSSLPNPEPYTRISFCLSEIGNDEPCTAVPLPISGTGQCVQPVQGTTSGATVSRTNTGLRLPVPNCGTDAFADDVWYRVVPTTTTFTLHTNDVAVGLARLYRPTGTGAQECSGAFELVNCQSSQGASVENRPLGTVLFDNLVVGQPYYLAVSNNGRLGQPRGEFTLCAQAAATLPVRVAAGRTAGSLWPNPVTAGEQLTVQLPNSASAATIRIEWLSAVGRVLPAQGPAEAEVANGKVRIGTVARPPGLYLLRLWLPDGGPLPVMRVVVQ